MTQETSIWRWAVTDQLEARLAQMVQVPTPELHRIAAEIAQEGADHEAASTQEMFAQTEARVRAMGLSPEDEATTLAGLREMLAEAAAFDAQEEAEMDLPEEAGAPGARAQVALASSQMFFDDPFAGLGDAEVEALVAPLRQAYCQAISQALADPGQSLDALLGLTPAQRDDDDVLDALLEAEMADIAWTWVAGDQVHLIEQLQEDRELPIDLSYARVPLGQIDALRARLNEI